MQIECKLKREGGSRVPLGNIEYHFAPLADGAHVAVVENEAHQDRFLSITEAYRLYRGAEQATAAPAEVKLPEPAAAPIALPQDAGTVVFQGVLDTNSDTMLYGSSAHPASFEIHGTTYSLGDIVARAHKGSGLDVQEWNELDEETRAGLIDDVLDELEAAGEADPRDANGDGTVDNAEERAALVEQFKAAFGKSPGNMGIAKLREKLAAAAE